MQTDGDIFGRFRTRAADSSAVNQDSRRLPAQLMEPFRSAVVVGYTDLEQEISSTDYL